MSKRDSSFPPCSLTDDVGRRCDLPLGHTGAHCTSYGFEFVRGAAKQPAPSPLDPRRQPVFPSALARLPTGPFRDLVAAREAVGVATYGETLHSFNGRDALRDALEELADAFVYLEQLALEQPARKYDVDVAQTHIVNAALVLLDLQAGAR